MARKKQKPEKRGSIFGKFHSPYMSNESISLDDCYQAYKQDPDRIVEIDGQVYSKIISYCRFYGYDDVSFHIVWKSPVEIRLHDVLIDEHSNEYKVRHFEMIRFASAEIPEWYLNAIPMVITGNCEEIGNYLAKKQVNNDECR